MPSPSDCRSTRTSCTRRRSSRGCRRSSPRSVSRVFFDCSRRLTRPCVPSARSGSHEQAAQQARVRAQRVRGRTSRLRVGAAQVWRAYICFLAQILEGHRKAGTEGQELDAEVAVKVKASARRKAATDKGKKGAKTKEKKARASNFGETGSLAQELTVQALSHQLLARGRSLTRPMRRRPTSPWMGRTATEQGDMNQRHNEMISQATPRRGLAGPDRSPERVDSDRLAQRESDWRKRPRRTR